MDSGEDCVNAEIENFLSLCRNATVHCLIHSCESGFRCLNSEVVNNSNIQKIIIFNAHNCKFFKLGRLKINVRRQSHFVGGSLPS